MTGRGILYAALLLLAVLHQDLWLWNDARMLFGLPIGLTYHVLYCLAVVVLMALLVRFAWPTHLDAGDGAVGP
jgi:hypothetical protein